jgi:hypothetical protein
MSSLSSNTAEPEPEPPSSLQNHHDSDKLLMERANEEFAQERLLAAARLLRQVQESTVLTERHLWILDKAERAEKIVLDLTSSPGPEWKKQGETHGTYDTMIYYKVVDSKLTARLETPIDQSLLIPLLAVFNETELFTTWMPYFTTPFRSGVRKTVKLRQEGRCNQLLLVNTDSPWPISPRDVLIDVVCVDDIDATGAIVVKLDHASDSDKDAPPVEGDAVRCLFDGGILFRKCPKDHASFVKSKQHDTSSATTSDMILVCFEFFCDPLISYIPQSIINFVTRTILGAMWSSLLHVAEDVRDGKRPLHAEAIATKREEVYDFIDQRIQVMLSTMEKEPEFNKEELGEVLAFL